MALELDSRYPGRFNPGDADYPQGSFKNRTAPGALDGSYLEKDWANDKEGFFQRLLLQASIAPNGAVDTALSSQYYSALLQIIQENAADSVNAEIATLAAAGTINLTTGAPDTSQLAISGTGVSINGFTVAANRFFIVKMTGASNTLVNSASLVTGRGANIPVVAGDSFLMRSTAANTVEIVCGDFLADAATGTRGQTWQDVTGSRLANTVYTNTTGRTIEVAITATNTNVQNYLSINGVLGPGFTPVATGTITSSVTATIRNGDTYTIPGGGSGLTLVKWTELR